MVRQGCRTRRRQRKFLAHRILAEIDQRSIEILCQVKLDVPKA
jgi:hypothetical protein